MDWTAPNLVSGVPVQADWGNLEDLAFWTETSASTSLGGGGALYVTGVFFMPNANPVSIGGNAGQTIGANAQFIARSFAENGGGTLMLRPLPNDVVRPPQQAYVLVR